MASFRAIIRFNNIEADDAVDARRQLEERLRDVGLERFAIVRIERQRPANGGLPRNGRVAPGERVWRQQANTGGVLLAAAALWAVWFFWQLSSYIE